MKTQKMKKPGPLYAAVYEVDRCYGGPEEGGWWYDAGTVLGVYKLARSEVQAAPHGSINAAFVKPDAVRRVKYLAARDHGYLRVKPRNYRDRYSVIGGPDIVIRFTRTPPQDFPQQTPHYE